MPTTTTTVNIYTAVPLSRIADLLCSALEGGSNYWYVVERFIEPPKLEFLYFADSAECDVQVFRHIDYPLNLGGGIVITTLEGDEFDGKTEWQLNLASIKQGLQVMAARYARNFADFVNEDDDAITGDVFLQCCLFGEVVYG